MNSERYKLAFEILSSMYPGTRGLRVVDFNMTDVNPTKYYASDNKGNVVAFIDAIVDGGNTIRVNVYKLDINGATTSPTDLQFVGSANNQVFNNVMIVTCYVAGLSCGVGCALNMTIYEPIL